MYNLLLHSNLFAACTYKKPPFYILLSIIIDISNSCFELKLLSSLLVTVIQIYNNGPM